VGGGRRPVAIGRICTSQILELSRLWPPESGIPLTPCGLSIHGTTWNGLTVTEKAPWHFVTHGCYIYSKADCRSYLLFSTGWSHIHITNNWLLIIRTWSELDVNNSIINNHLTVWHMIYCSIIFIIFIPYLFSSIKRSKHKAEVTAFRQGHRVYRVPGLLSSRPNWLPHPSSRKRVLPSSPVGSGGQHPP
jgi:hypothetical protein